MADFFLSSAIGLVFTFVAILLVLGSYFIARAVLGTGREEDRTHDVAATVAVRIAALHGLILALVYAQELSDYQGVRADLTEEAVAISDVYNDIHRYGGVEVRPVREGLASYVNSVVHQEWDRLGRGQGLSPEAWIEWDGVYRELLDLVPRTNREEYLSGRMRNRITVVAELRQKREAVANGRFSGLFWAPALIGLVLLAVPLYVYRPTRTHLLLFSLFGAYSGVILFFIFSFSNPFLPPGKLEPKPFLLLLQGDLGKSLPNGDHGAR